jgi:ATP-dependent DNA helicase RecQ
MNTDTWTDDALLGALRKTFGHAQFRPGQLGVVRSVLGGTPTLAVMPTGAGKSLCYQLPAALLEGTTLVVSPLLALMKDQVDRLRRAGVAAAFINSSQTEAERAEVERQLAAGRLRIVFVAPERFRSTTFARTVGALRLALLAIDEAHCISEWGHAFRPDFELLGDVVQALAPPRLLALTATATPDVRADIVRALRMVRPSVTVAGFDRPNLHLEVHPIRTEAERLDSVVAALRLAQPAIVYAATRRQTETIAKHLRNNRMAARAYHGGVAADERSAVQDAFVSGSLDVVVATNAFGLGIDKPDVRLVLHAELPRSLEAYYQEVGRAGRDGKPAVGALLFAARDIFLQKRLIELGNPTSAAVSSLFRKLTSSPGPLSREALLASLPKAETRYAGIAALAFLESLGLTQRTFGPARLKLALKAGVDGRGESAADAVHRALGGRRGEIAEAELARKVGCDTRSALQQLLGGLEREGLLTSTATTGAGQYALRAGATLDDEHLRRLRVRTIRERQRLEQMISLAQRSTCRRATLLSALGERDVSPTCTSCDVCAGHRVTAVRSQLATAGGSALRQ